MNPTDELEEENAALKRGSKPGDSKPDYKDEKGKFWMRKKTESLEALKNRAEKGSVGETELGI